MFFKSFSHQLVRCVLPVRKHPLMPPQLAWLFATRPVFLYPELLPHVSLDPALHSTRSVSMFTAGEDCLIVLGLRNLGETLQPKEMLCHYLLRAKKVSQLRDHILEKCKPTHANNVIKVEPGSTNSILK
uniref:Uncharacterized protein n=1 Tax=Hucho hucho TaxID=62062 RepID=A0A4W5QXF4_9TELE